jgi:hypothetical protein
MILLKINGCGVTVDPFESDPPRSIHRNCIPDRLCMQRVETPAGYTQIVQRFCAVEYLQPAANPFHQVGPDPAGVILQKQVA